MGLGPLFSGAGDWANQVSTHESKTKNYFGTTLRLVSRVFYSSTTYQAGATSTEPHGSWVIIGQTVTVCNKK
jgi:hypothetical protein